MDTSNVRATLLAPRGKNIIHRFNSMFGRENEGIDSNKLIELVSYLVNQSGADSVGELDSQLV